MYIDVHTHLNDDKFIDDLSEVEKNCESEDIGVIINSGFDEKSSVLAYELSKKYKNNYFSLGVHPDNSENYDEKTEEVFFGLSKDDKCLAIGETGFDFYGDKPNIEIQKKCFLSQMILADKVGLPFVVHSRSASQITYDFLSENKDLLKNGFLLHCYSESKEMAERYLDLGAYFSFGGVITFKNAKKEEIISAIPKDRILTETDSPYLTPEPFRGQRNDSSKIPYILRKIASIYDISEEEMKAVIYNNAKRLFKKL